MKKYYFTLLHTIIAFVIFLGLPYLFGGWLLWISWLPAGFVFTYLEDKIEEINRNNKQ